MSPPTDDGTDLSGRTAVVTGATSGIGEAAATAFARMGARTILLARSEAKADASRTAIVAASGNDAVEVVLADLSSQKEIRRAAGDIRSKADAIDILFNNAGVAQTSLQESVDGIEMTWAVNHLGYFLLTQLLLDRLESAEAGRIVNVASDAHKFGGPLRLDDLESRGDFGFRTSYGRSKLANILFTTELARRLREKNSPVTVNAFHPGFVRSGLGAQNGWIGKATVAVAALFANSPEQGARTGIMLATSPAHAGESGGYYARERPHPVSNGGDDPEIARKLWEASEGMTAGSA